MELWLNNLEKCIDYTKQTESTLQSLQIILSFKNYIYLLEKLA